MRDVDDGFVLDRNLGGGHQEGHPGLPVGIDHGLHDRGLHPHDGVEVAQLARTADLAIVAGAFREGLE